MLRLIDQHDEDQRRIKRCRPRARVRFAQQSELRLPATYSEGPLPLVVLIGRGQVTVSPAWQCPDTGAWNRRDVPMARHRWLHLAPPGDVWRPMGEDDTITLRLEGAAILRAALRPPADICVDHRCHAAANEHAGMGAGLVHSQACRREHLPMPGCQLRLGC